MKDLTIYSVEELLEQFKHACRVQYDTYINGNYRKYNKLQDFLLVVARELKRRGLEERRCLLTLFSDPNPQVRLQAATKVYSVAPAEAKACIEAVAATNLPNVSLSAGMTLLRLSEVPDCLDWI